MSIEADIRKMRIQSSASIASAALEYLYTFSMKRGMGKPFAVECKKLVATRPTAVALSNAIGKAMYAGSPQGIRRIIEEINLSHEKVSENSRRIFKKKTSIMTHCHSTFTVGALIANKSRIRNVIVTETRPKDQGVTTAGELARNGIKTSFIIDSAVGNFINDVDIVLVGADALRKEGLVNKIEIGRAHV